MLDQREAILDSLPFPLRTVERWMRHRPESGFELDAIRRSRRLIFLGLMSLGASLSLLFFFLDWGNGEFAGQLVKMGLGLVFGVGAFLAIRMDPRRVYHAIMTLLGLLIILNLFVRTSGTAIYWIVAFAPFVIVLLGQKKGLLFILLLEALFLGELLSLGLFAFSYSTFELSRTMAALALASGLTWALERARHRVLERLSRKLGELESDRDRVKDALSTLKMLRGLVPICPECHRMRDDRGYWQQLEVYLSSHSEIEFTHSICPDCAKKLYGDLLSDEELFPETTPLKEEHFSDSQRLRRMSEESVIERRGFFWGAVALTAAVLALSSLEALWIGVEIPDSRWLGAIGVILVTTAHWRSKKEWVYLFSLMLFAGLLVLNLAQGGDHGGELLWFFTLPAASFFFLGSRQGAFVVGLSLLASLALLLPEATTISYEAVALQRALSAFLLLAVLSGLVEHSRSALRAALVQRGRDLEEEELQLAALLSELKELDRLLPICSSCKSVRDDRGYWQGVERYLQRHPELELSIGLCPQCQEPPG